MANGRVKKTKTIYFSPSRNASWYELSTCEYSVRKEDEGACPAAVGAKDCGVDVAEGDPAEDARYAVKGIHGTHHQVATAEVVSCN